jgi:ADP-ribose pyrophosphatase
MAEHDDVATTDGDLDLSEELDGAIDDMSEAVLAYSYDGDRSSGGKPHTSGEPTRRGLVLPELDPRDAEISEKVLSEDTAWRGRIFDINRLTVELPDGRTATRDVLRHPGAVGIVALTGDGRICLVRQYRTSLGRVTVEIPAGKLDVGEDPLECARRELLEETGMKAERMAFLSTIATGVGFCDELIHLYMATNLSFAASDPDADEFINVDLVPLNELIDAVLDGRIEDAKTVVGALICDSVAHRLTPAE